MLRLDDDFSLLGGPGLRCRHWGTLRGLELFLILTQSSVFYLEGLELAEVLGALGVGLHAHEAVDGLLTAWQGPSEAAMTLYRGRIATISFD